jgi:predicted  nucleic acid-binding Zn-ribbon protein
MSDPVQTELEESVARFEAELAEVRRALELADNEPPLAELKASIAKWIARTEALEHELFDATTEFNELEAALRRATA